MKIAFYLRLSIADGDLGKNDKDESNSIENQRILLQTYLKAKELPENDIAEYIDDGYSGLNFDRPAFQRMIEDAKQGKIDTILVKDLSRLGRDYICVGAASLFFGEISFKLRLSSPRSAVLLNILPSKKRALESGTPSK